jgi:hypothetical protein
MDERDRELERLRLLVKWAHEDNARLLKLVDDAVAQLRTANECNAALRQQRIDDAHAEARVTDAQAEARIAAAHAETVAAEERLARAVLNARAPTEKLH